MTAGDEKCDLRRQEIAGFMLERFPFDGDVVGGLELGRIQGEEEPWERRVGGRGDQEFRTLGEYVPCEFSWE